MRPKKQDSRVPHDLDAEEAVLGCCLLSVEAVEIAVAMLVAEDFYRPSHSHIFEALRLIHSRGDKCDAVTVADQLRRQGSHSDAGGPVTTADLLGLQANTPAISGAQRYSVIIARHAVARKLIALGMEIQEELMSGVDPLEHLVVIQRKVAEIDSPIIANDPGDLHWDDFLNAPVESHTPWVIPGLLRQDWRVMFVAGEGAGKTWLLLMVGVMASWGLHPFDLGKIPPANTLIIDLENPADVLRGRIKRISEACYLSAESTLGTAANPQHGFVWSRPFGINLRKRADRAELTDILRRRRPNLITIGPLYKLFRTVPGADEKADEVALEVIGYLDDLRDRFGFALLMEHHAPLGQNGQREMRPFGSSLWSRWPELGFSLIPPTKEYPAQALRIEGFRGDRVEHKWPRKLVWDKTQPWPWVTGSPVAAAGYAEQESIL